MTAKQLIGGHELFVAARELIAQGLLDPPVGGGVALLLIGEPQAQQHPQTIRFQRQHGMTAGDHENLIGPWVADAGEFFQRFPGFREGLAKHRLEIILEDPMRNFGDLADAPGAYLGRHTAHPGDREQFLV